MERLLNRQKSEFLKDSSLTKAQITEICTKALNMHPARWLNREDLIEELRTTLAAYPDPAIRPIFLGRFH